MFEESLQTCGELVETIQEVSEIICNFNFIVYIACFFLDYTLNFFKNCKALGISKIFKRPGLGKRKRFHRQRSQKHLATIGLYGAAR